MLHVRHRRQLARRDDIVVTLWWLLCLVECNILGPALIAMAVVQSSLSVSPFSNLHIRQCITSMLVCLSAQSYVTYVTNLALWLQYFNKLTYILKMNISHEWTRTWWFRFCVCVFLIVFFSLQKLHVLFSVFSMCIFSRLLWFSLSILM